MPIREVSNYWCCAVQGPIQGRCRVHLIVRSFLSVRCVFFFSIFHRIFEKLKLCSVLFVEMQVKHLDKNRKQAFCSYNIDQESGSGVEVSTLLACGERGSDLSRFSLIHILGICCFKVAEIMLKQRKILKQPNLYLKPPEVTSLLRLFRILLVRILHQLSQAPANVNFCVCRWFHLNFLE